MICFELSINGKRLATAGIPDQAVLSANVTWAGDGKKRRDLFASLGGLDSNTAPGHHLRWLFRKLKVGDSVAVRVVEGASSDPAVERKKAPTNLALRAKASSSYRAAVQRYKKQRAELDAEIARLEGLLKKGKPSRELPKP